MRDAAGFSKLGSAVLWEMSELVEQNGMGYFPTEALIFDRETPPRQYQKMWVFMRDGSKRSQVIDAVLRPERHDVRAALDGLAGGDPAALNAEQKLDAIRELVN
ncbi:hypothetical protein [Nocardioides zeae]